MRTGFLFGIPSIVSMFITRKWIVPALPRTCSPSPFYVDQRHFCFRLVCFADGAGIVLYDSRQRPENHPRLVAKVKWFWVVLEGLLIGCLTGFGWGGRWIFDYTCVGFTHRPSNQNCGGHFVVHHRHQLVDGFCWRFAYTLMDWPLLLTVTAFAIAGTFIGNKLSKKISQEKLKKALAGSRWPLARGFYTWVYFALKQNRHSDVIRMATRLSDNVKISLWLLSSRTFRHAFLSMF